MEEYRRETQRIIDELNTRHQSAKIKFDFQRWRKRYPQRKYVVSPYYYVDPRNKPHYQFLVWWILQNLPRSTSILEVGCATGLFGLWLRELGYNNYTGVDINNLLIQVGHAVAENLDLQCMDGRRLTFEDDSFDFVGYINNFFDDDPPFFIKEGLRVAKIWAEFDGLDAELLLQAGEGTRGYKYLATRKEIHEWLKGHEITVDIVLPQKRHLYIVRV